MSYDVFEVVPGAEHLAARIFSLVEMLRSMGVVTNIESTQNTTFITYRLAPEIYRPMMEKEKP